MTALDRYQRLEGTGLWRPVAGTQRRDVAVRLGKSSLIIADARSGTVLSHWALSTVRRINPGRKPAAYQPGPDTEPDGESLQTEDDLLIEAIETIRQALSPPPRTRQLRLAASALAAVLIVAGVAWLPQVLVARTAQIVPQAMRAQIGREALDDLARPGGPVRVCAEASGRQALSGLRNRVLGPNWRVVVLDGLDGFEAGHLPGQMAVLSRALVERLDSPEALAGWMLAEEQAAAARDPMLDALRHAGIRATLSLLSTAALPDRALNGYAGARLTRAPAWPEIAPLAARLAELGISPLPYADSLPPAAARQAAILGAAEAEAGPPLLSDGEWLTLQAVCQG